MESRVEINRVMRLIPGLVPGTRLSGALLLNRIVLNFLAHGELLLQLLLLSLPAVMMMMHGDEDDEALPLASLHPTTRRGRRVVMMPAVRKSLVSPVQQ